MSNRAIIEKELTQGVVPIGVPKAYQYDQAIVESAVATVQQGLVDIASATNDGETSITNLGNKIINQIKSGYGYPFTASTSSAMTDQTKIYVYTGTTGGGFTQGNWYYWNGSAWTSGGVYNSTALETDTTLSISGMAGDSKTIGDIFKSVVLGGYTYINASTKEEICNGTMDDIPVNTIYTVANDANLTNNPGFTGVYGVLTFSCSNTRSNRTGQWQFAVSANGTGMYYRGYNSGVWSSWQRFGTWTDLEKYLRCQVGTFNAASYSNALVNIIGAYCGFIVPSDYNDSPIGSTVETPFAVFPMTTSFSLQLFFPNRRYGGSFSNPVYYRIVRTNGTVYKDWQPIGEYDARRILAIGDSICRGDRNENYGFVGGIGVPFVNAGVSGARISSTSASGGTHWIEQQLVERTETNFDAIIMEGGINDYINNIPLGTLSAIPVRTTDTTEYNALDTTTVIGALEHMFVTLQGKYPNIDKFFLITHKTRNYPFTKNYTNGYTQDELHDAIVSACRLYNVQVIDVYAESPINTYFPEYVSPTDWADDHSVTDLYWVNSDKVHPLNYGYHHGYVPFIVKALRGSSHK